MASAHHPTKEKLIETTARLLRSKPRAELSSELILSESGISKGSLYHHFEDLDHLIEQAMLKRYTDWVDVSISSMTDLVTRAKSREDLVQILIMKRTMIHFKKCWIWQTMFKRIWYMELLKFFIVRGKKKVWKILIDTFPNIPQNYWMFI